MTTLPPDLIIAVVAIVVVGIVFAIRLLNGRGAAAPARRDVAASRPSGPPSSRIAESSLTPPLSDMHDDLDFDGATGPVIPIPAAAPPATPSDSPPPSSPIPLPSDADVSHATPSAKASSSSNGAVTPTPSAPPIAPRVAWPQLVSADAVELDEAARVRLLGDLGIVRAPWCVPILLRACEEETNPAVRRAALGALGGFRASADARSALELAVAANDADERAIATAALRTFD